MGRAFDMVGVLLWYLVAAIFDTPNVRTFCLIYLNMLWLI